MYKYTEPDRGAETKACCGRFEIGVTPSDRGYLVYGFAHSESSDRRFRVGLGLQTVANGTTFWPRSPNYFFFFFCSRLIQRCVS